jgi:hypothetical protein
MRRLVMLLAALLAAPVLAQKTTALAPENLDDIQALEEIVVSGDRTLSAARQAIVEAENRFYDRWNALNTERQYDITCRPYTPTGTRLSTRVCQPRFVEESTQAEAARLLQITNGSYMSGSDAPRQALLVAELKRRTLEMVNKDPDLKRALLERARLEQHYEALRKEKFKDRWIVWK